MRFKSKISNIEVLTKVCASISSLGKLCLLRLEPDVIKFTLQPDKGSQVWAVLPVDLIFENEYICQSAADNAINMEINIADLHRALRSALGAKSAELRLTKKPDKRPFLVLTAEHLSFTRGNVSGGLGTASSLAPETEAAVNRDDFTGMTFGEEDDLGESIMGRGPRTRQTVITQEVCVKVVSDAAVEGLHQPHAGEPSCNIILPKLLQLKSISERFTKLSMATGSNGATSVSAASPRLELSANMHGTLKLATATDALRIETTWTGLVNPQLNTEELEGYGNGMMEHPTIRLSRLDPNDEEAWAKVRIDGRDWARVLSVGRLSPRVVASFIHNNALVLYVFLPITDDSDPPCLTYYVSCYSA